MTGLLFFVLALLATPTLAVMISVVFLGWKIEWLVVHKPIEIDCDLSDLEPPPKRV